MFIEDKSQQLSTNTRSYSVSLYYLTKVFFNFKVFHHLLCEYYYDNHIFLWSNAGGYLASKLRCKKLFAIDVKGFPSQFFSSQIFWKMPSSELFFHCLEIYSFVKTSWSYQTYELSMCGEELTIEGSKSFKSRIIISFLSVDNLSFVFSKHFHSSVRSISIQNFYVVHKVLKFLCCDTYVITYIPKIFSLTYCTHCYSI